MGCDKQIAQPHILAKVSIHAPTWGATPTNHVVLHHHSFQSTHPRGVRLMPMMYPVQTQMFQSTHPRGVRHTIAAAFDLCQSFNPRTHMGCDVSPSEGNVIPIVSIHAPTWGATYHAILWNFPKSVSIHAPTWGATAALLAPQGTKGVSIHAPTWGATLSHPKSIKGRRFQSTHPRGVRPPAALIFCKDSTVSIHAPTWGATCRYVTPSLLAAFQSTHPRGVRPSEKTTISSIESVSIHAPTWGATFARLPDEPPLAVSIHAPTWGATNRQRSDIHNAKFQSTHPRGVRPFNVAR